MARGKHDVLVQRGKTMGADPARNRQTRQQYSLTDRRDS